MCVRHPLSRLFWLALIVVLVSSPVGCQDKGPATLPITEAESFPHVVTTTNLIADVVRHVGGERVAVTALMRPGVAPHLYKAREGDVLELFSADVVLYHGLFLEGKMAEILGQLNRWVLAYAVAEEALPPDWLLYPAKFEGHPDPHIWFDVQLARLCGLGFPHQCARRGDDGALRPSLSAGFGGLAAVSRS